MFPAQAEGMTLVVQSDASRMVNAVMGSSTSRRVKGPMMSVVPEVVVNRT